MPLAGMGDILNILHVSKVFPRTMVKIGLSEPLSINCLGNIKLLRVFLSECITNPPSKAESFLPGTLQ